MLIMRYEKKLELLNQSIQNIKEEVNELKNTTQNNRSLIEKIALILKVSTKNFK